jgi:hypothetical protein
VAAAWLTAPASLRSTELRGFFLSFFFPLLALWCHAHRCPLLANQELKRFCFSFYYSCYLFLTPQSSENKWASQS